MLSDGARKSKSQNWTQALSRSTGTVSSSWYLIRSLFVMAQQVNFLFASPFSLPVAQHCSVHVCMSANGNLLEKKKKEKSCLWAFYLNLCVKENKANVHVWWHPLLSSLFHTKRNKTKTKCPKRAELLKHICNSVLFFCPVNWPFKKLFLKKNTNLKFLHLNRSSIPLRIFGPERDARFIWPESEVTLCRPTSMQNLSLMSWPVNCSHHGEKPG